MKKWGVLPAVCIHLSFCASAVFPQTLELEYSTFLGGGTNDEGYGVAVDSSACAYVTGVTKSTNFPTSNSFQATYAGGGIFGWDAFISKFASTGTGLIYSTYLGGADDDFGWSVAVDSVLRPYIAGQTNSLDFPTKNGYQASFAAGLGSDVFLTKLSSTGASIWFSTYLGGNSGDTGYGVAVDDQESAYLTGEVSSEDFPTANAYQPTFSGGSVDAFVVKFASPGDALEFATYLGGGSTSQGFGIAVDADRRAYVTGDTKAAAFPTADAYQATFSGGNFDAFLAGLASSGQELIFSTYLGGVGEDIGKGVAIGMGGGAYVVGETDSNNFPTLNPYQPSYASGNDDAFVTKFSLVASSIEYSTYLGGSSYDRGKSIDVDEEGSIYLCGETYSADFPTLFPYQPALAGGTNWDVFVSSLASSGSSLVYSTYLGGYGVSAADRGYSITLDSSRDAYVAGIVSSANFPTRNAYQSSLGGTVGSDTDAFLFKLVFTTPSITPTPTPTPTVTPTPTASPSPSVTPTPTVHIPTPAPTASPSPSVAPSPTARIPTPAPTATPSPSIAPTSTPIPTPTPVPIETPTPHVAPTPTALPIPSPSPSCGPNVAYDRTVIASGDYDGNGAADLAIFRPSAGLWSVKGVTRLYFGNSFDQAVPGDYDGDGTAEITIFRAASGLWSIKGLTRLYFGASGDLAVPSDWDGNGSCDIGIFRENGGLWSVRGLSRFYFGSADDWPIPGDYGNDGTAEAGLYRSSAGQWMIRGVTRSYFGSSSDWPVPGDYQGTEDKLVGIFRPCSGMWAIRGVSRVFFGNCFDYPRPADFNGDGSDDIGIFRNSTGLWSVKEVTRVYFGSTDDIPVTR